MSGPRVRRRREGAARDDDFMAGQNRAWLAERNIVALNLKSSPGGAETSLPAAHHRRVGCGRPVSVIEGDQETRIDAQLIRSTGAPVV